jgi:hypothetical protein
VGVENASILARFAARNLDPALAEAVDAVDEQTLLEGIIRLNDPDQIPHGFSVVSRFDRICTGRFPAGLTWAIRSDPNTLSLKAAQPLGTFDWDTLLGDGPFDSAQAPPAVPPGWPFTGRNCVVAALDFGLDFTHPNFLNPDGTTRLLTFWHQAARYDSAHPNRFGYGRIFSRSEIDAAIRAPDPYAALASHPSISDSGHGSHGTLTLDIAAGNGRAPGAPIGMAPNAHLLFVHLSTPRLDVPGYLGDSVRLLEALDFVNAAAAGLPWVVNLSIGAEAGGHDGTSPVEQGMHELLRMGPDRVIAQSAGNYQSADLAVNGWIREGECRDLDWIIDPRDTTPNQVDMWYSGSDRFVVAVRMPHTESFVAVRLGTAAELVYQGHVVGRVYHRKEEPSKRDHNIKIYTYVGAPPGTWTIRLIGEYVISGRFHAWIERDLARPGAQSRFDARITSPRYTLGTIATSPLVLTVGAFDPHTAGEPVAPFSSFGPTRDERRDKAELLAGGVGIVGARSTPRGERRQAGLLVARSGTSFASPRVAGACAVLFEAAGRSVSVGEIREALRLTAHPMTADDPPDAAAWGRLNLAGAIQAIQMPPESTSEARPLDAYGHLTAPGAAFSPRPVLADRRMDAEMSEADGGDVATVVRPLISVARRVVIVKHPHTTPTRQAVALGASAPFNGSGLFTRSSAHVDFYLAPSGGAPLRFDGVDNVLGGAQLVGGVHLYAEGAIASTTVDDVELRLALRSAGRVAPAAIEHLTAVDVTLDICQSRTAAGVEPVPLSMANKISIGRFVQVQDRDKHAGRAMLTLRRTRPAAFRGTLTLTSSNARLQLFEHETGTAAALALPLEFDNSRIPVDGLHYWVEGQTASGALRDTELHLGVKDVEPVADRVSVTVVAFNQIQATIQPTRARTLRAGYAAPAQHVYTSTSLSDDLATNHPLVLMRNAQPDIHLVVTCAPAGLPLRWEAIRNRFDHASLGDRRAVPVVTSDLANPREASLNANEKGSFFIRCYIDCNAMNTYSDGEPSIPLPLVLANARVVTDDSVANSTAAVLTAAVNATGAGIRNGTFSPPGVALNASHLAAAGMAMRLTMDVTGGGSDGRVGLDRVFVGLINNLQNVDITAVYRDPAHPAVDHHLANVYASNRGDATGGLGGDYLFQPGDPAPARLAWPVLDTGRPAGGTGGETATMTSSQAHSAIPRSVGERWTSACLDSPGRSLPLAHPVQPGALLQHVRYHQEFTAYFCFWTNVTCKREATGDPADRVYSVIRIVPWEINGEWDVDYAPAVSLRATVPHQIRAPRARRTTVDPIGRAQDHGVEVRPPSGISQVFAWDART